LQIAHLDEGDNVHMGNYCRLKHSAVTAEEFCTTATITDKQLAIDQFVTRYLINAEEPIEFVREGFAPRERPNPH